jgi:hypothetical protein
MDLKEKTVRMWIGLKRLTIINIRRRALVDGIMCECSKYIRGVTLSASEELWSIAPGFENSSKLST